jgi:hypothetical protein
MDPVMITTCTHKALMLAEHAALNILFKVGFRLFPQFTKEETEAQYCAKDHTENWYLNPDMFAPLTTISLGL